LNLFMAMALWALPFPASVSLWLGGKARWAKKGGKISVDINVFIRYRPRQRINTLIIKTKRQRPARR